MEKKEMFLQVLWERGHSNLWKFDFQRKGIVFNCFDVTTSQQVGGFAVTGESTQKGPVVQEDEQKTAWEVFVPFGVTAFLDFHSGWDVAILCTFHGPLEISSVWLGGGPNCYQGMVVLTDGETYALLNERDASTISEAAADWEAAYQNEQVTVGDKFVKINFQA